MLDPYTLNEVNFRYKREGKLPNIEGGEENSRGSLGEELKPYRREIQGRDEDSSSKPRFFLSSSLCFLLCFCFLLFLECSKLFF